VSYSINYIKKEKLGLEEIKINKEKKNIKKARNKIK
jgi:hypothetical protein